VIKNTFNQDVVLWSKCFLQLGNELAEKKLRREVGIPAFDIIKKNSEDLDCLWVFGTQSLRSIKS
jgi:hypothetical protein